MKKLLLLFATLTLMLSTTLYGYVGVGAGVGEGGYDIIANVSPTASDYIGGEVDVGSISRVISNWLTQSLASDADGDTLTAKVKTQGRYGTFSVKGDYLSYVKTTGSNTTDTGTITISDGVFDIEITVSINALYWEKIAIGDDHTLAIKSDGTLWGWGSNNYGQLGLGTNTDDGYIPTQEISKANNWSDVAAGSIHSVAIKSDGTLWAWGNNIHGQLGDGTTIDHYTPTQESSRSNTWSGLAVGPDHTIAIKSDGTLWAWGGNYNGQLGDGTTHDRSTPTQESSRDNTWSDVVAAGRGAGHTLAIKSDGTLWAWGSNGYGELGDGTWTNRSTPTQESSSDNTWSDVAAGKSHSLAIKSDGTLWAWGYNSHGQLGDGNVIRRSYTPTQESSGDSTWSDVAAGRNHSLAIKSNGSLWGWGANRSGQLGDGTTISRSIPTQERSDSSWSYVAAGRDSSLAVKSNGTLLGLWKLIINVR